MHTKEIIGLMKGRINYTKDTLCDLKNVVEKYPYFQTAQLLYTLNLQAINDSRFNVELKKANCYSSDRRNLSRRVKNEVFRPERIEKLKKEEKSAKKSSFDLVDSFLAKQEEKGKKKKPISKNVSPERISTDYLSGLFPETQKDTKIETKPLQYQDVIDKFLVEDEKSPVKIVLKDEPENWLDTPFHDLDTIEKGSFFSETLAKIYLKQKKYVKALEIIRKLYLHYPEKNRYFADQIRFLEKLVSNIKKTE